MTMIATLEQDNALAVFDKLEYWKVLPYLEEKQVLRMQPPEWDAVIVPEGSAIGATKAEDIFRYILDLEQDYSLADVEKTYHQLILQWQHDKVPVQYEDFGIRVSLVLQTARRVLTQAVEDKGKSMT